MPYNKDAYTRYKLIDACLRRKSRPVPALQDIVDYVGDKLDKYISTSSIQKDIYAMRYDDNLGFNAPIAYDGKKKGYYYSEPDYYIEKLPISEEELQALEMSLGFLQQYTNMPAIKVFEEAITKMAASVKKSRASFKSDVLIGDKDKQYVGVQFMQDIVEAIRSRRVVKLKYQSFQSDKLKEHTIHPYFIKEYSGRLYLVANDVAPGKAQKFLTFSFDRIVQLDITQTIFKEQYLDKENYFSNALGVSNVDDKPLDLELKCHPSQAKYLKSQPIHHSQSIIVDNENEFVIKLKIVVNQELKMRILAMGHTAIVIKPDNLRKTFFEEVQLMQKNYD
jgi:predicted DNA-binding transcriptional regulator YafY